MDIFVTGGSGFVGRALCAGLRDQGHQVTVLTRSAQAAAALPAGVGSCLGDPTLPGPWQGEAARPRGFFNLAGASIFHRWTADYKRLILDSRLKTTRHLVQAIGMRQTGDQAVLVSASAVGYYGFRGDEELDESSPAGEDFLASVCRAWEHEAQGAEAFGARVVRARFGIVLGESGGALEKMLPLFRLGLGGPLGSGRQWFSWVHRRDLAAALLSCLADARLTGPVNCTAPHPVTNRTLAQAMGRALGRPAFLPAPGFAIRLALGELGSVLLNGQRVLPRTLLAAGFAFSQPDLAGALADILGVS
ncbi:MAG: TIGR01777 family oxidoreductase [Pseudomonadota bacterium]